MYIGFKDEILLKQAPNCFYFYFGKQSYSFSTEINETAFQIIKLLNGQFTINEIIENLSIRYNEPSKAVREKVLNFINSIAALIDYSEHRLKNKVINSGSNEYYTPHFAIIELTHNCPLRCKHCFLNAGLGETADFNKLKTVIQKMIKFGIVNIQLTGGEPFVYSEIEEIIDMLIAAKISISITTSGFVFNPKVKRIIDKLVDKKTLIQVSLDGLKNTHDEIRQVKGTYKKVLEFIKYCVEKKLTVAIATTIIDQEYEEVFQLSKILRDIGVRQHRIGSIIELGRSKENNIKTVNVEKIVSNLKKELETETFIVQTQENINPCKECNCGSGFKIIKMSPNFDINPCIISDTIIGNLNIDDWQEIFKRNSNVFSSLKRPFRDSICIDCDKKEQCNNCMAQGVAQYQNTGECAWYEKYYKPAILSFDKDLYYERA